MKRISSLLTMFCKTVYPAAMGLFVLGSWFIPFGDEGSEKLWAMPILFTFFYPWLLWYVWPLKSVFLLEDSLMVKGMNRSVTIPLSQVKSVEPYGLINQVRQCLTLREPCEFGSKIIFIPRYRYLFFPDKKMIKDLKSRIKSASLGRKGAPASTPRATTRQQLFE